MKHVALFVAAIGLVIVGSPALAHGSLLNLTFNESPDVFSGYIDVSYNSGTDEFIANGWTLTFYRGDPIEGQLDIYDGYFDIQATIDSSGHASSAELSLTGDCLGVGPTLLTGSLIDFGSGFFDTLDPDVDVAMFEYRFAMTGGDLASYYGGIGKPIGVILSQVNLPGTITGTQFGEDFNNNGGMVGYGTAVSDTGVEVPEPMTLSILALGAVALVRRRRS